MSEDGFSAAAYAVIRDEDGRVLLARRRQSGEWLLPGGTVKPPEAPWEAVVRELREETGVDVALERLVGVYAKRREQDLVFVFTASIVGGSLRASDERDRVEFIDPRELPADTTEHDRARLDDALSGSAEAVYAVQPSQGEEPPDGVR